MWFFTVDPASQIHSLYTNRTDTGPGGRCRFWTESQKKCFHISLAWNMRRFEVQSVMRARSSKTLALETCKRCAPNFGPHSMTAVCFVYHCGQVVLPVKSSLEHVMKTKHLGHASLRDLTHPSSPKLIVSIWPRRLLSKPISFRNVVGMEFEPPNLIHYVWGYQTLMSLLFL